MPISIIAMLAVGFVSAVWAAPKVSHAPPISGGVFAAQSFERKTITATAILTQAPIDIHAKDTQMIPCNANNCEKESQ